MASTGYQAVSVRCDLGLTEQPIEVVPHHRLVLAALLKQEASQSRLHQPVLVPLGVLLDEAHHRIE